MNTIGNYQQSVNFNGRVDRKSAKLAKKLGGEVLGNLENLAAGTNKTTVVQLSEMDGKYAISAFNTRVGLSTTADVATKGELAAKIKGINPRAIDESIVNEGIKYIKTASSSGPINKTEANFLKSEAKDILKVQRELGINKPFWTESKKLMRESNERYRREIAEQEKKYYNWEMSMLKDNVQ